VAHTFSLVNNHPKEEAILGIALCGTKSWLTEQGLVKEKVGFLHLKGIIEALFERLGIQDYSFKLSPDASSAEIDIGRQKAGLLIKLKKEALNLLDIKNEEVLAAELSLDKVFSAANLKKKLRALPVYPGIVRDTSIIVKEEVPAEEILGAIRAKAGDLLQEVRVADYYRGKHIPAGFKGLTISCLYRAPGRTLTEAEVNPIHSLVLSLLSEDFRAQIR
jgi:phenylalanyl-tRNA synthetase beta chain